ncbi:hypothetical protein U1Q18_034897 [Sarracenia purpurea var. burkii]
MLYRWKFGSCCTEEALRASGRMQLQSEPKGDREEEKKEKATKEKSRDIVRRLFNRQEDNTLLDFDCAQHSR